MTRLVRLELTRIWWRRVSKGIVAAFLIIFAITAVTSYFDSRPPSAEEQRITQENYERVKADWDQFGRTQCYEEQQKARDAGDTQANFGCDQMRAPQLEDFGRPVATLPRVGRMMVQGLGTLLWLLALILGASLTAAEFSSGTMGTYLTFQPRRLQAAGSKLTAMGLWLVPAAVGALALIWLASWGIVKLQGTFDGLSSADVSSLAWLSVRTGILTVISGVIGTALGLIFRNTTAAVGVFVGYILIVESIFANLFNRALMPWALQLNIAAFQMDGAPYYTEQCQSDQSGFYRCNSVENTLSMAHGAYYLAAWTVALIAIALVTFRRRDVN